ncbi:MAG: acetyl-CoA C-acetyltransferase [candidate division Zixibacteria bacterium]|nr:acetyl-CoA C-acetyltransferase [candidate division Zixibacteria bacterium]MBU1470369.1 acetyl-CoA C-acetyltransferase [candidate division Zixibacteria bacterium]MBU2624903.1 acetyl-CoA C-acetyltransferase [candidate division Zixibacteria bacterium]
MDTPQPVIVSACRTAIGNFLGGLSSFTATQLGAIAIKEAVKRAGIDPAKIEEVIMGQVVQAGVGQAPARQAAIHAGIPPEVVALTINKVCGSGLKAAMMASASIKAGDGDCYVVGGMESMSGTPYVLHGAKGGLKFGDKKLQDSMILDGLWDSFNNFHMGNAAELTVVKAGLTREEQDEFAANSHAKALAAIEAGKFVKEIVPVEIPQRKGDPVIFKQDECPRPGTTVEKLAKLRPAFQKDGTVTAGNAPGLNDGAAAMVVTSADFAKQNGLKPLAKITGYAAAGVEPKDIFFSPIYAVRKLMNKLDADINYFDLIEANEAFAAQALADGKGLGWDWDRVNVHGGAVALGHPIGASGARIVATLIYALQDRGLKTGLATLCLGGGNAVAMSIELM